MNWFNKFRFKYFVSTRSIKYSIDFFERVYEIYLNHKKVIHFRDGQPVFSLSTPAVYSKPAVNLFARSVFSNIQNRSFPNLMSYAINDICNVQCEHCSFYESVDDKSRDVLDTKQAKKIIKDGQDLGVSVINIVGGEPLLRKDLLEVISSVNKDLSTVILFTNGWLLAENAKKLKQAGLDGVYISIDNAEKDKHDKRRHKEGLFNRAMKGVKAAKASGLTVGISCTISEPDYRAGELEKLIELGKNIGIHEVLIFDMVPVGRAKDKYDLVDNNSWIDEMIKFTEKFNKDLDYPGVLVYSYSTSYRATGCSGGTSYFYVSPYGDIFPCDFNHSNIFGNVLKEPLYKIWDRLTSDPHYNKATWGGCKMKDSKFHQKAMDHKDNCSSCKSCS